MDSLQVANPSNFEINFATKNSQKKTSWLTQLPQVQDQDQLKEWIFSQLGINTQEIDEFKQFDRRLIIRDKDGVDEGFKGFFDEREYCKFTDLTDEPVERIQ